MNVLLDTNVLLDAILRRAPWHVEADQILQAQKPGVVDLSLSSLTVATSFYVSRKLHGMAQARQDVRNMLQRFIILPVDDKTLRAADALAGADYEDNIQIAAAVAGALDVIVTRDTTDFSASPILVLTPAQLLAQIAASQLGPSP